MITIPISWAMSHEWLQQFAYRTNISWWVFIGGIGGMFGVASILLGLRTYHASTVNPVKSLRAD